MDILSIILQSSSSLKYIEIGAAIFFPVVFLVILLIYTLGPRKYAKPKIITLKDPIHVIGIMTKTSNDTFIKDDMSLWKEYKLMKERKLITNKKEEHSFIAVRMASDDENKFDYLMGDIVNDFSNVPVGLKAIEIPAITLAVFPIEVDDERSWGKAIKRIEKHFYNSWLPNSEEYELDTDSPVREIEYHDKRTPETTRVMLFYVAIRKKTK